MAGVGYTTTRIYVDSISVFAPGGSVRRWCQTVGKEIEAAAHDFAPPNRSMARWSGRASFNVKGALQASIYRRTLQAGKEIDVEVGATAPHARFVHDGTAYQGQRYIYTNLGWANKGLVDSYMRKRDFTATAMDKGLFMPLPPGPFRHKYAMRVRGQKANPFLTDAYGLVARRHSGLPRKRFARSGF